MRFPKLRGIIRRRILVNFRVRPEMIQRLLPNPFKPKLLRGWGMVGICLIRLEQVRFRWLPAFMGLNSENSAHRIAVRWTDEEDRPQEGVYIPRRDTSSIINYLVGGRLFPGEHHKATFQVRDDEDTVELMTNAPNDSLFIEVHGRSAERLPTTSIFSSLEEASDFFKHGSLGYSETKAGTHLDGIRLMTKNWMVRPLHVTTIRSSCFEDPLLFPRGSIEFDCALIMRNIEHEWLPLLPLNSVA